MNFKPDKINIPIIFKVCIQILITYLILTKGDAGRFIHDFGVALHQGNAISGVFRLIFLFIIYLIIILIATHKYRQQIKIMLSLYVFDIILTLVNLFCSTIVYCKVYDMPLDDALFKFVTLASGSAIIYILLGLLILIPIKKYQSLK